MTLFEDRLRAALVSASGERPATAADWAAFQTRLARKRDGAGTRADGAGWRGAQAAAGSPGHDAEEPAAPSWLTRWRAPLLSAAAVVVVAAVVTAIVAGRGSSGDQHVATPGGDSGTSGQSTGDGDAPDSSGESTSANADVSPTTDVAPTHPDPVTVPVDTSLAGTASQNFNMQLVDSGTDRPALHVTSPGGEEIFQAEVATDGTPLGYLAVSPSEAERPNVLDTGGSYLYGVVGPSVDRIAVLATPVDDIPDGRSGVARSVPSGGPVATFASTDIRGVWDGDSPRVVWADLDDGWHGFALQVGAPSPGLTVIAWNASDEVIQVRSFSPDGSTARDHALDRVPDIDWRIPESPLPRFGTHGPNGPGAPMVATFVDSIGDAYPDALFEGTIAVHDGCVIGVPSFESDDDMVTLIFPQSLVEPALAPAVLNFKGVDYEPEDAIAVGGGMASDPSVPEGCPTVAWGVSPY